MEMLTPNSQPPTPINNQLIKNKNHEKESNVIHSFIRFSCHICG